MAKVKKHIKWLWNRILSDRIGAGAAHAAFFFIISLIPFLALFLTILQRVHFAPGQTVIDMAISHLPDELAGYVRQLLPDPIKSTGLIPVAAIAAAWTSSKGMRALISDLEHIFGEEEQRGFFRLRIVSFLYIILLVLVLLLTGVLLVFGSSIYNAILEHSPPFIVSFLVSLKSIFGFVLLFIFFTLLYTFLPKRKTRLLSNAVGGAFAAAGWILFSAIFSFLMDNFLSFSVYGGLATVVILMYWLFYCFCIIFLGGEVCMWFEISDIRDDIKNGIKGLGLKIRLRFKKKGKEEL